MALVTRVPTPARPRLGALKTPALAISLALALLTGCGLGGGNEGGVRETQFEDSFIAAKVNGRPIYNEDVRAFALATGRVEDGRELDPESTEYQLALHDLITQRLFAMEAESRGLDRDPEVRRALDAARERILSAAVERELEERATDPAAIERLYRENSRQLGETQEVQLRHIQFDTREAASTAKRRLDEGETFERLAFELSRDRATASAGGALGWMAVADLDDGLRQAADSGSVGAVVGPVQSQLGWHLVEIVDRRQRGAPSLASLRDRIIEWQRFQETNRLRERLESTARIEIAAERPAGMAPDSEATVPADGPRPAAPAQTDAPRAPSAQPPFPFPMGPGGVASGAAGPRNVESAPTDSAPPTAPAPSPAAPAIAAPPIAEERET